eukprot:1689794-Amphidinium_carterae.1
MRIMSRLYVDANLFAGTLPNRAVAGLNFLLAQENGFEGKHRRKMSQTPCFCGNKYSFHYHPLLDQKLPITRCTLCSVKSLNSNVMAFE